MKSLCLITMLAQLIVQMPDKGVSAINFTLTGSDVVDVQCSGLDKVCDWNRVDSKTCHVVIYGGKRKLTNKDVLSIRGYQTLAQVKMVNVVASSPEAEAITIANMYRRG